MTRTDGAFYASLLAARLADQVLLFLVPLVVFQITGSVAWSGLAFFFETLPRYLAFPLCGILCDRRSPLALMRMSQRLRFVACAAGIAGFMLMGGVGWLVAISAATGVLTTQGLIAREVMLPQVFAAQRFERVASYTQLADQLGTVLGPILAAFLLGFWRWEAVVVATAALFLAADALVHVWVLRRRPVLAPPERAPSSWIRPLADAGRHILLLPGLLPVVLLAMGVNLVIGVTLATSAAMVTGAHAQSAFFYAGLQTAGAIATIVVLVLVAQLRLPLRLLGVGAYAAILAGGVITGIGPGPWTYAAGFVLVIGFDKMFNVYVRTVRQRIIPQRDFGKVTGLIVMLNNLPQPLAGLLVGMLAGAGGGQGVILALSAAMAVIGVMAWALARRAATPGRLYAR